MDQNTQHQNTDYPDILSSKEVELFRGRLALLSILSPTEGVRSKPRRNAWYRFLDDLCGLCDPDPGGKTVVAVAVEGSAYCTTFWVAANSKQDKAYNHLKWLLESLDWARRSSQTSVDAIEASILDKTVHASCRKLRNYAFWLQRNAERAEGTPQSRSVAGTHIFTKLHVLELTERLRAIRAGSYPSSPGTDHAFYRSLHRGVRPRQGRVFPRAECGYSISTRIQHMVFFAPLPRPPGLVREGCQICRPCGTDDSIVQQTLPSPADTRYKAILPL